MISKIVQITFIFSLTMSQMLYADCLPSPEPCNDTPTTSTFTVKPAEIIIPLVLVGAGLWYWLYESEEPSIKNSSLKSDEVYTPYSLTLAPLPNNEVGGVQLSFAYEF